MKVLCSYGSYTNVLVLRSLVNGGCYQLFIQVNGDCYWRSLIAIPVHLVMMTDPSASP